MKINQSQSQQITLELAIENYTFSIVWDGPNSPREIKCSSSAGFSDTITENQVKALVSALKEAKVKFNEELDKMEELLRPFTDYVNNKNIQEK